MSATHKLNDSYSNSVLSSRLEDALYLKGYNLVKLGNDNDISFIAFKENYENNNELRYDAIELMDAFYQDSVIVKYFNENKAKRIMKDGSERTVGISNFNGDMENSYYNKGFSFSFIDEQEYFVPKKESDLKSGMIVEIKNNQNQWIPREVMNVSDEWGKMYNLLVKYNRIRCLKDI